MKRREFLEHLSYGAFLGASLQTGAAAEARRTALPNIVVIYADDLGYGDISCYGARKVQTPNIDTLARSGVRFTNAHSTSATCTPSRYSLLTGEYAWRRQGTDILPGDARMIIQPGRSTMPSMLRQQGYRTGVVGKWHLGLGDTNIDWNGEVKPGPLEIGFDYSFLLPATGDRVPCVYLENHRVVGLDPRDPIQVRYDHPIGSEPTGRTHPELLKLHPSHGHDHAIVNGVSRIGYMTGGKSALWVDEDIADTITRKAVEFMTGDKSKPFFLYFATHDIHVPRVPHPRFRGKTDMGARGDAIAEFDWSVGQVLDALKRNGLAENTMVIVSSDNGPVVDDGYRDRAVELLGDHRPAGQWRGGKYSNFDGGTRVPFVLRWPGHVTAGMTSDALVSHVDLFASFAALTGHKLGEEAAPDSLNAMPALLGKDRKGREHVVEHAGVLSVIRGGWKFIEPSNKPKVNRNTNTELGNDTRPQLYNLARDPGEKQNLAAVNPEKVRELEALLAGVRKSGRTRH